MFIFHFFIKDEKLKMCKADNKAFFIGEKSFKSIKTKLDLLLREVKSK